MNAISDLPSPSTDETAILDYTVPPLNEYQHLMRGGFVTDHFAAQIADDVLERIEMLSPGQTMKDLPRELQHPSFRRRAFRRVMDGTPTEKRGGAPSGLKRLQSDEPCLTITSAAPREFVHPTEDRFLTIRECARIQSFPDYFQFEGSMSSKITLIGNAIPPLIAKVIADHIRLQVPEEEGNCYDPQPGRLLGYYLTKATAMSPALARTEQLLKSLMPVQSVKQDA
jgi:DNA (cytosine-5)-methyltransferase 1